MHVERSRGRILVVNIPIVADALARILESSGYATTTAYSGESAIRKARLFKPHVIVSAVDIPCIDGFKLATLIRKTIPACNVVLVALVSWNEDPIVLTRKARKESLEVLINPARPSVIFERVKYLCANRSAAE